MECTICGKKDFLTRASLDLHRSRKHSERTWICPKCPDKKYTTKKWLNRHMVRVHGYEFVPPPSLKQPNFAEESESIGKLAEQRTTQNKIPFPEAEEIYSIKTYRSSVQPTTRIRFANLGVTFNENLNKVAAPENFLLFSKAFHNVMHREMKRLRARSQDYVQWTFDHPGLEFPISVPLTKVAHSSVSMLLDAIDRVLQSSKELKIDSEIKLDFAYIVSPRISSIDKNALTRNVLDIKQYLTNMRSIVSIPEFRNGQCFAYALAAAARDKIPGANTKSWYCFFRSIVAENWVKNLTSDIPGVRAKGPWSLEQCKEISRKFSSEFKVAVYCFSLDWKQGPWKTLWCAGSKIEKTHYFILIHNDHAYFVKSLKRLIGKQYVYCKNCGIIRKSQHFCITEDNNSCKYCRQQGCTSESKSDDKFPRFQCHICRKTFVLESCLEEHVSRSLCVPKGKIFCAKCHKTDLKKCFNDAGTHKAEFCGFSFCRACNKRMPDSHEYHFLYPVKKKKEEFRTRFYYFDIESRTRDSQTGEHVFVLVCLQDEKGTELVWRGVGCVDRFMEYLFTLNPEVGEKIVLIAHNFSRYDAMGVLAWIYKQNLDPKIVFRGQSVYSVKFRSKRIEFKDSYLFIPTGLSNFNKLFGLQDSKSFFPHAFHTYKNEGYTGPLPAQKYYCPETMSPARSKEFYTWWEEESRTVGNSWSLQKTLESYCSMDVTVLRQGASAFGETYERIVGFNPLNTSITISAATMRAFKLNYLQPDCIVQCSDLGLQPEGRHSRIACAFIAWLEHLDGVRISSSLRGKEITIMRWRVDGYLETTADLPNILPQAPRDGTLKKIVIEYYGCAFHGMCSCVKPDQVHPFSKLPMDICRGKTLRKISTLVAAGYYVVTKTDCQFRREIAGNPDLEKFVNQMDGLVEPIKIRDCLYGGRTNCVKLHYTPKENEELVHLDFVSMYPYLNSYSFYPTGEPEVRRFGLEDLDVREVYGIVKCSVLAPEKLFMPVLPVKIRGKLLFGLCFSCMNDERTSTYYCNHSDEERCIKEQTWVSEEIKLALKYGYKVTKIYEVWHWKNKSDVLFRGFMMKFYEEKLKASGIPAGMDRNQFVKECNERYGFNLEPEDITDNPPRKQTAKLGLNNFWGKFGERNIHTENKLVRGIGDIIPILLNNNFTSQQVFRVGEDLALITWKRKEENLKPIANSSIIPACWTTAMGRILLCEEIFAKLSHPVEQLCYFDTDGCVFIQNKDKPEIVPCGGFMGGLANEIKPGNVMKRMFSSGPKSWGYQLERNDGKLEWISKNKGIKLTNESLECLPIEKIWKAIYEMDTNPKLIKDSNKMKRDRLKGAVYSRTEFKKWRINITKRIVCEDQQSTLPFGYLRTRRQGKRQLEEEMEEEEVKPFFVTPKKLRIDDT